MQKKQKNAKMDEYEQSFGYWQHSNNNQNNPENETTFYGFEKSQN